MYFGDQLLYSGDPRNMFVKLISLSQYSSAKFYYLIYKQFIPNVVFWACYAKSYVDYKLNWTIFLD